MVWRVCSRPPRTTGFAMAAARADRIEVRWPSGRNEAVANVPANQIITIEEGRGIVAGIPFSR